MRHFCGIDFGGTAAKVGIVDQKGSLLGNERLEIAPQQDYEGIFRMVAGAIRERCRKLALSLTAIGIGSPGFIDREEGRVLQGSENLPAFRNRPLTRFLADEFAIPVFADNDANCAAAGELEFGIGARYRSFVMLTLGAGVGGAFVFDGRVFRGTRGLAGEIGHLCLDAEGPFCTCGSRGCLEQYASAPAITRAYLEKRRKRTTTLEAAAEREISAREVFGRAGEGDGCAVEVVRETALAIARTFGNLVNLVNPQACIIGGGISAAGETLLAPVREHIADFAWPLPLAGVEIHTAALQNHAGILGAAAQCLERLDISASG